MSCECDSQYFPDARRVPAGLDADTFRKTHALGLFPDWRNSLLAAIGRKPALDAWRARDAQDLGLMLAEMMAYVGDSISFYDALIAAETYVGTAQLPGAQRQLVALLGYKPRPAVAASALLAAQADGKALLKLPAGTAFRSSAFEGNPPQVFETSADTTLEPRINSLPLAPVRATTLPASLDYLLAEPGSVRALIGQSAGQNSGQSAVLDCNGVLYAVQIAGVSVANLPLQPGLQKIQFSSSVSPPANTAYANTRLLTSGASVGVWKLGQLSGDSQTALSASNTVLLLEGKTAIRAGDVVLVQQGSTRAARRVTSVTDKQRTVLAAQTSTITLGSQTSTLTSPVLKMLITELTLDAALPSAINDPNQVTVFYALSRAARIAAPIKNSQAQNDAVHLPTLIDAPRVNASQFLLEDTHAESVSASGTLNAVTHSATLDSTPAWGRELAVPMKLHGNVVAVSRGESVSGEILGSGDATQSTQTFTLKKKPLTYLSANNEAGYASTLQVRVGGVLWQEVPTFYGLDPHAQVYTVQHDEAGATFITFGGAARLPSGALITADYRFGAGAASPPAQAISQLAKPVPGLKAVRNLLPAFGGADAETNNELRRYAPRSALLLGRAISLADLEAAAAQVAGVKAVRVRWQWDAAGLQPAAVVTYIGDEQLTTSLRAKLRALAEPDAPISVVRSLPQSARLAVALDITSTYDPVPVIAAVKTQLMGEGGVLRSEVLGPDGVLFASHVIAAILQVPGVKGLRSMVFNEAAFTEPARQPNAGYYFDFSNGLVVTP